MSNKNYALILLGACLTLLSGLIFLFDAVDIAFEGAIHQWYLVLMLYLAAFAIGIAIIRNAPLYFSVASIFIGVFLSLSLGKSFAMFWPMIPITMSLGMFVSYIASRGRLKYVKPAIVVMILSLILLIGSLTRTWRYIVPVELIVAGIIVIIFVMSKVHRLPRRSKADEKDYHVRPTKETIERENQINNDGEEE